MRSLVPMVRRVLPIGAQIAALLLGGLLAIWYGSSHFMQTRIARQLSSAHICYDRMIQKGFFNPFHWEVSNLSTSLHGISIALPKMGISADIGLTHMTYDLQGSIVFSVKNPLFTTISFEGRLDHIAIHALFESSLWLHIMDLDQWERFIAHASVDYGEIEITAPPYPDNIPIAAGHITVGQSRVVEENETEMLQRFIEFTMHTKEAAMAAPHPLAEPHHLQCHMDIMQEYEPARYPHVTVLDIHDTECRYHGWLLNGEFMLRLHHEEEERPRGHMALRLYDAGKFVYHLVEQGVLPADKIERRKRMSEYFMITDYKDGRMDWHMAVEWNPSEGIQVNRRPIQQWGDPLLSKKLEQCVVGGVE